MGKRHTRACESSPQKLAAVLGHGTDGSAHARRHDDDGNDGGGCSATADVAAAQVTLVWRQPQATRQQRRHDVKHGGELASERHAFLVARKNEESVTAGWLAGLMAKESGWHRRWWRLLCLGKEDRFG